MMMMNLLRTTVITFSLFIIANLVFVQICHAQNSPQDYVDTHNEARALEGVGDLEWDDEVAAYAQDYANQRMGDCALMHSSGSPYGENLAVGSNLTGTQAIKSWVDEKINYDYESNTCADGEQCGHYTQVVWSNSVRLGCARVQCDNGLYFVTCNYDPPGNIVGEKPF